MHVHVFDRGAGRAVVFLHGLPSPPADLEGLAEELPSFRVLVPHVPGYGRSPAAPGRQSVAQVERALVERLRALGVERPVLVGFSMGAYRVLSLAAQLRASSVLALAGFADMLRANKDIRSLLAPRFLSSGHRAARPSDDAIVEAWLDVAPASVLIEELDDLAASPSLTNEIAHLDCPVVARTGELDMATPASHARAIAATAKHGTAEIVPGVGHALLLEDRAGTLDAVRRACAM